MRRQVQYRRKYLQSLTRLQSFQIGASVLIKWATEVPFPLDCELFRQSIGLAKMVTELSLNSMRTLYVPCTRRQSDRQTGRINLGMKIS